MTKEVQLAGGDSENQDAFVGAPRELTVDTSNQELRLHDGVTPGGAKIINRDAGDARWQGKNSELDNFSFASQLKGFAARVSPGNWRIRSLTVNTDNMVITHPQGISGNPLFELAPVVLSAHEWDGLQTFSGGALFPGGLQGNLIGDVLGNVIGNVLGNLVGNATGNHAGSFTGNVDTEGHNLNMGDGQIQLAWLSAAIQQLWIDRGIPLGTIVIWYGIVADIPDGFFLCDGDNGTPDLRGLAVLGAGGLLNPAVTGGATSHVHGGTTGSVPAHSHTGGGGPHSLTVAELPVHKHGNGVTDQGGGSAIFNHGTFPADPTSGDSIDNDGSSGTVEGWTTEVGSGDPHEHAAAPTSAENAHDHDYSDMVAANHLPPYMALCYIMKGV